MPAQVDFAAIVRHFLARFGPNADQLPADQLFDPFDYTLIRDAKMKLNLPAGLRGKLATLHTSEQEIASSYAKERGRTTQDWVGRKLASYTGHDCALRESDIKEQNELSQTREHWYCDLSQDEKAAFDAFCLAGVENVLSPLFPVGLPRCLHGPISRLALESAGVLKSYTAKRSELHERLRLRGTNWTVVQSFVDRLVHDQQDAQAQLEGRWLRELTQRQQDALDGVPAPTRESCAKPKRRRRATSTETRPLTDLQKQAVELYGELQGDFDKIGERMGGISRQAARKHVKKGLAKLDQKILPKPKKRSVPTDERGQDTLSDFDPRVNPKLRTK